MDPLFNNRLRQLLLLAIIVLLAILLLGELYFFIPGFLGAITLYILQRELFFNLTIKKKWNRTLTSILFITASLILIALPIYFSIQLISNKISDILSDPGEIISKAKIIGTKLESATGIHFLNEKNILAFEKQASSFIPGILNSSANVISNFAIMFFLQYFLLKNGREMENFLSDFIPLKEENVHVLANETKNMIRANAIGIPVMAVVQGIVAMIGYRIFGVTDFVLWGFVTAVCSVIPVVGTAIIWVPLTAYFFAVGNNYAAVGLLIYSVVITTNIDYVARLTLLKKLIDVHPIITLLGVIIGVSLLGFWGVVFGPLFISYFIILIKIYINEFGKPNN